MNEPSGQVDDPHGFAHVQREDLAPRGQSRSLQHELHRLFDAHEVTGHRWIGDRDRAPALNLAKERGDHASPAPHDVSEPDRTEHTPDRLETPDDLLGEPLGAAHDARRSHSLVRGDQHQAVHAGHGRGVRDGGSPDDVREQRLPRMGLEYRHVLVCGRMEDHLRSPGHEQLEDLVPFPDVGKHGLHLGTRVEAGHRVVEVALVMIEQDQRGRHERRHLTSDLGADRPAGAGDHHPASSQEIGHGLQIRLHLLASQEILDPQIPDVPSGDPTTEGLPNRGQHAEGNVALLAERGHLADDLSGG